MGMPPPSPPPCPCVHPVHSIHPVQEDDFQTSYFVPGGIGMETSPPTYERMNDCGQRSCTQSGPSPTHYFSPARVRGSNSPLPSSPPTLFTLSPQWTREDEGCQFSPPSMSVLPLRMRITLSPGVNKLWNLGRKSCMRTPTCALWRCFVSLIIL